MGNVLQRHGISPTPERVRNSTWHEFIRQHRETLWACDFFTSEVWTRTGLTTFYILFFIHAGSRRIVVGGITRELATGFHFLMDVLKVKVRRRRPNGWAVCFGTNTGTLRSRQPAVWEPPPPWVECA